MASSTIKKTFREAEVIDKASHPYLFDNAILIRNGGVVSVFINGLKDIPVGAATTIFTLPLDYRPLGSERAYDITAPSTSGVTASLRVRILTNGDVTAYVYYAVDSSHINNLKNTLTFAI